LMKRGIKLSQKISEKEINWSYEVMSVLKEGLDKVAAKPECMALFVMEFMRDLPDVLDAFVNLVEEEHRGVVVEVVRSAVNAIRRTNVRRTG